MNFYRRQRPFALFLAILFLACAATADSFAYRQSIEKWRHDYEAQLTSENGWLTVSGLFWLHEGENHFGSDPLNDIIGYVLFTLHGQEYRLEAEANRDGSLFIVFRDLTSGKLTYPASRFLDTEAPKDGPNGKTVQLDFNKAYNPPCAYNPYTTCPVPLPANRLRVEIPAGEKLYKHPHP